MHHVLSLIFDSQQCQKLLLNINKIYYKYKYILNALYRLFNVIFKI